MKIKKNKILSKHFKILLLDVLKFLEINFNLPKILVIKLIKFYRYILSPIFPASCRFYPTCSYYAEESFQKFGFCKALYFSSRRILKCNPFNPGGFDPVSSDKYNNYNNFEKNNY